MARSSLLGIGTAATEAPGRDKASLGPSDNSDSGSDVAGLGGEDDDTDPGLPVDVALRDDQGAPLTLGESLAAGEGGTGVREGADIGVDRIFSPGDPDGADTMVDAIDEAPANDEDDVEESPEDEAGDEGDVRAPGSARRRARAPAAAPSDAGARQAGLPGGPDSSAHHRPRRS